jgi:patatin-like phospholipase/acyl hydrolase
VLARRSANQNLRRFKAIALGGASVGALIALALLFPAPKADATPNFARQTGKNCSFCHSGVPRLNDTGLAFRKNGFHFPESNKPSDNTPRP